MQFFRQSAQPNVTFLLTICDLMPWEMVNGKWNETRAGRFAYDIATCFSRIIGLWNCERSSSPFCLSLLLLCTVLAVNKHQSVLNPFHFEPVSVIARFMQNDLLTVRLSVDDQSTQFIKYSYKCSIIVNVFKCLTITTQIEIYYLLWSRLFDFIKKKKKMLSAYLSVSNISTF